MARLFYVDSFMNHLGIRLGFAGVYIDLRVSYDIPLFHTLILVFKN